MKVRCKTCKDYVDRDEALRFGVMSFCDSDCAAAYQRKADKKKPKKSPMPADLRAEILARDDFICSLCPSRSMLQAHHVKYRSEGGKHERRNLITLCEACHSLVHSKKSYYKPMCQMIVDEREDMVELIHAADRSRARRATIGSSQHIGTEASALRSAA